MGRNPFFFQLQFFHNFLVLLIGEQAVEHLYQPIGRQMLRQLQLFQQRIAPLFAARPPRQAIPK